MEQLSDIINVGMLKEWWPVIGTMGRVAVIALLAWGLLWLSHRLIRHFKEVMTTRADISGSGGSLRRIETLIRVFRYIASVLIVLVAAMLILSEFNVSIAPILGAAGVVGLAVGFGAQSLIKDFFTGVFLLIEDQIRVGDVVEAGGKAGVVEEVTLRYLRLRDHEGSVHFVPNGLITTVTNKSRGFAFAVADVGIAYRESIDEAFNVMREVGGEMRRDETFGAKIFEDIEIVGVENWTDSAVMLRCRIKVRALEQWNVRREFLRRLKQAFDEKGIEIPYPHLTLYAGEDKKGNAPPIRVMQVDSGTPSSLKAGR